MKIYKVGGAVRDQLLGLEPIDNDWVVVGSTPNQMLSMGYKQVGKDFPVFLHPETKEEYALARKERSTGPGHTAFNFSYSPNVTLEEDLSRRDITINAIAMDDTGNLIDPFNGKDDLDNRIIRHVSDAFIEDPLRVLRVARFYSKLKQLGFEIHKSTEELLTQLIPSIIHLPGERIWQETEKILKSNNPVPYFELLYKTYYSSNWRGNNNPLFNYADVPAIDTWINTIKVKFFHKFHAPNYNNPEDNYPISMEGDWRINPGLKTPQSWWAILVSNMKKRTYLDDLNKRLKVPNSYRRMSELVFDFRYKYFKKYHMLDSKNKVMNLFQCLERIQPSKDLEFATSVTFLAAHNILGKDINLWRPFLKKYSEILPTNEEKKLDGSQIQEILKERKMRFIEEEIKRD
ncbi:MAG: multifunctional CCA tRNA nucleotidyl transferase/2'3'-cyclic phosphodiesterase/2'nucleotidase/phosphatase [Gammaproteobacteria bacterium]|nr:multifunctional CCA tRNA nucleotidyl transferase/2'3'-cyclic phosphodiesterase/2'nucleotidase/phosphatase [Gammaproteobacteria bacterium]